MTDTSTVPTSTIKSLEQQRSRDLQLAKSSTNPAGRAHDIAQAEALRAQITSDQKGNASAAQASASAASTAAASAAATATTDQTNAQNATTQIGQTLSSLGLGAMTTWATNLAYTLAGQGIDPTTIVSTITSQLNNPLDANGQVDQAALDAFNAALPGFNQLIKNTGSNGSPGATPAQAIAAYISYSTQIQQFAASANLAPGTINAQTIGDLWANNISASEASDRITEAVSNANIAMSNQAVGTYLTSQGLSAGTLASYYINPENTMAHLNSINTGIGAASSGFGQLSQSQSTTLAAFLATPSANGINPVSAQQAQQALTSTIGPGGLSAAAAANAGFENAATGTSQSASNPGVVSQDQLLAAVEGNAGALSDVRRAAETRGAASQGGGGFASDNAGVAGVGYGSQ